MPSSRPARPTLNEWPTTHNTQPDTSDQRNDKRFSSSSAAAALSPGYSAATLTVQDSSAAFTRHSRSRTASSSNLPSFEEYSQTADKNRLSASSITGAMPMSKSRHTGSSGNSSVRPPDQYLPQHYQQAPLNSLSYRNSSGGMLMSPASIPYRTPSTASSNTSASRPVATSSYVSQLRRQKATVWCDRAQHEDPRLLAQQKAAKVKAAMEVIGSSSSGHLKGQHGLGSASSSTSSIRGGKFKGHHSSSSGNIGMVGGSLVGGLPPRLSATEANGDSDEDDENLYMSPAPGSNHRRSGSGRSSLNSNHRKTNRAGSLNGSTTNLQRQGSQGSTSSYSSPAYDNAVDGTGPVQDQISLTSLPLRKTRSPPQLVSPLILEERTPDLRQSSEGYFDSQPAESSCKPKNLPPTVVRGPGTLKRMGSVDERESRTMTMTGLRLVVANPD